MDLLEAAFEQCVWESIIDKGVDKTINRDTLRKFCTSDARIALLDSIVAGRYHITPPKVVSIPKDNGKTREIYVNRQRDRILLAAINQAYYMLYGNKLAPACKAYREGISCAKVVREVARQPSTGYKLDLSKYFDSIPIEVINAALDELDTGSPLDVLVRDYYNDNRVYIDEKIVPRFKSLAQGCAIAAFLSNYVLRDIDFKMMDICRFYCRYSDDMLILGDNAESALEVLKKMLSAKGLSLNMDKVEPITPEQEFKFLGFGVSGSKITISQKDFVEKKKEVKRACCFIEKNRKLSDTDKLYGAVNAVKRIFFSQDPTYGWLYGKALGINDYTRLAELDNYCKEHIRAAVTGKWNFTSNMNKVPESSLREAGYVSLVHMAKIASFSRDLYTQEHLLYVKQRGNSMKQCLGGTT